MSVTSEASTSWKGSLTDGSGEIALESSNQGPFAVDWKARSEGSASVTTPEELLAAAHSSCFSMALSHALAGNGTPPESIETTASVTFIPGTGITGSHLNVNAVVPGLSAEDFAAFDKAAQGIGANGAALDAYRPWLAAFMVAGAAPMQAGYRPEAGVDKTLMDRARAEGKTIHGFETADRQLRLIAGMSEEAQIAYLNNYVRNGDQIVSKLDQTVAAWLKGDAAEVGRLNRLDTRDVHEDIHRAALVVRNADWTDRIETMMQGSGSAFVAVGVAHLADQDSVIDMLTARGFTVERL